MATVTSVKIEEELAKRLERMAKSLQRTKGWLINEALREYLERDAIKKQRWHETEEALNAIESGEVYDADEVHAWMDSWFTDHEQPAPHKK